MAGDRALTDQKNLGVYGCSLGGLFSCYAGFAFCHYSITLAHSDIVHIIFSNSLRILNLLQLEKFAFKNRISVTIGSINDAIVFLWNCQQHSQTQTLAFDFNKSLIISGYFVSQS